MIDVQNQNAISELERKKYIESLLSKGLEPELIKNMGLNKTMGPYGAAVYPEIKELPVDYVLESYLKNNEFEANPQKQNDEQKMNQWMLQQYLEELHAKKQDLT